MIDMVKERIPIPEPQKRDLLIECGHKCSMPTCEVRQDLMFHHINFKPSDNRVENILVLCPNHAAMADKKKIDIKACQRYKEMLGKPTGRKSQENLKEIIEQEGIDLPTDRWFVRFVLERGRRYLMKKYGKIDVPLSKEIKILYAVGIGFLVPILFVVGWAILFSHGFNPNILYLEIGLALLGAPAGVVFYTIQIIEKRKCKKCSSNFGIEMSESKLVDRKVVAKTQDFVKIQEIQRNTYTCKFCGDQFTKNESIQYNEPLNSRYM